MRCGLRISFLGVRELCAVLLVVVVVFAMRGSLVAGPDGRPRILVIYDNPVYPWLPEYACLKDVLSGLGEVDYFWGSIVRNFVDQMGAGRFVEGRGYRLIVVLHFSKGYAREMGELLEVGLKKGCSFLFLVQSEDCNVVLRDIELFYSYAEPVCNVCTGLIADHEALVGVWCVGVREWCVCGYYSVYREGCFGVVSANESWWGERYALVVLGRVYKGRVAAIAPYIFAEDVYDNRVLLENVVRWLLGLEVRRAISPYYPLKSLESERARLLNETECLRREVECLRNECEYWRRLIEELRANYSEVLEKIPDYRVLKERVLELERLLNETRSELNATLSEKELLEERVAVLEAEARYPYRILGLAVAVALLAGFYVGYVVGKRRGGGSGGE